MAVLDRGSGRKPEDTTGGKPHPGFSAEEYLAERLAQYQSWYDKKAVRAKATHLRTRTAAVVGGSLVPVLVNLDFPYAQAVTTVVSLVVAGAVSLESVFRYREQWKNYRSTEQTLGHERVYFLTRTGIYTGMDETTAFSTLVERVEATIANENAATLSVMTQVGFAGDDGQAAVEHRGNR
ncbi:DUF4231 domain-containing protein [Micromonospora peucetia]|uniref:DUF4231 domain-containing protein n=1 Tax=Micromonospora peucetia TaxID=47871 RepID=A0A1C6W795_9ACTN|nr:DUF4231 domain-containing protein [Micromonospora peucetia]MCX4385694.1 DUF4231 domain-containing protein [Micromonospora peucetia]WSA33073.1 DUF4231 domain-containing protein [Micromonospora peucetia]SCL74090.1 Protein of unknown function (DUF4231) [Micromonospora peucetia]